MKDFVKTMLAVICGYIVLKLIGLIIFIIFLVCAFSSGSSSIPKNGVLDLDLSNFNIAEQTEESPMPSSTSFLGGDMSMVPSIGIRDAVEALRAAADDPGIPCVLLRADGFSGGVADVVELRAALTEFRRSGKPVIAYTENPGNASYFLSTVADKIYMGKQHGGNNMLIGVSSQMIYLKDILDKLGVHVQLIRHGKYKSAGEMFIRSSSSPENREQNQQMVNSLWKCYGGVAAAAREIPEEDFNALIDNLSLNLPEDFLAHGLVDALVSHEELVQKLCIMARVEDADHLALIPFVDYTLAKKEEQPGRIQVAVLHMDGEIVEGKDDYDNIAADRFVQEIDRLRKNQDVKAVVLRVNSPGGSVSASEKIRAALDLLQKEKPLVASFGNYAASGGYWISNGCQKIYANPTSITGSIGVFSMIPEFSDVTKKVGVGIETVGSNKHSDMFSLVRPFDTQELAFMQASVEDIYERFVNLVAEGRGMEPDAVDAIAQGRVWTGADALEIGLVDELGTLQDAIAYAAALADFTSSDQYSVADYPEPLTFLQQLMLSFGESPQEPTILEDTPFEGLSKAVRALKAREPGVVYARLPYAMEIR
ncbi:MAG: signal peptide peptidase SppA [Bacteroidales bacterium]|nr:signal peptide peptidase SppA [Bacteroidales bacterium]